MKILRFGSLENCTQNCKQQSDRYISKNYEVEMAFCHGCATKEPKEKTSEKVFKDNLGDNVTVNLCEECLKDC